MKAQPIPTKSRDLVRARDEGRCVRCSMPAKPGEWSHRRSRSVRDEHVSCPCNGAWMCSTCHRWCHANPKEAASSGWFVNRANQPASVPMFRHGAWVTLTCDGATTEIRY